MLRRRLVLIMLLMCPVAARAEPAPQGAVVRLWPQGAPASERRAGEAEQLENGAYVHNVHAPSLTVFRADPSRANGVAMIVIPGGGHRMLVFQNEGVVPAKGTQPIWRDHVRAEIPARPRTRLHLLNRRRRCCRCTASDPLGTGACGRIWRRSASDRPHGLFGGRRTRVADRGQSGAY